jgi:DNA polymerase family A
MTHQLITISSWKEAQTIAPTVLERLNADPSLLMAAASNPLLALQELGYEMSPSFREEFVDLIRFGTRGAIRLRQLRKEIFSQAGKVFDLDSPSELERLLFEHLNLPRPPSTAEIKALSAPDFSYTQQHKKDPLATLREQHPLVDLLLEYRRLNARAPGLAPREFYDEIRAGKHQIPVVSLRVRFKTA